MKHFIPFILLFISGNIYAQITLQKSDFPTAGDLINITEATDLSIDYVSSGANSVWDFSELSVENQTVEETFSISSGGAFLNILFGGFAPAQYKATYFQKFNGLPIDQISNFLPINIGAVNQIVKTEDEKITTVGYSLEIEEQQVGFKSDIIETDYQLPLDYGDYYTSQGRTEFDFSPFYDGKLILKRNRESEVDGFGELITPYFSYENVIRIHHRIEEQDSLRIVTEVLGFPIDQWIPINRTLHQYEWWGKNNKRPILKIETEEIVGNETVRRISFINDKNQSGISNLRLHFEINLYPNPAQQTIFLTSEKRIDEISIYDINGKLVFFKNISAYDFTTDIHHLPNGQYNIYAKYGNDYFKKAFIKKE